MVKSWDDDYEEGQHRHRWTWFPFASSHFFDSVVWYARQRIHTYVTIGLSIVLLYCHKVILVGYRPPEASHHSTVWPYLLFLIYVSTIELFDPRLLTKFLTAVKKIINRFN